MIIDFKLEIIMQQIPNSQWYNMTADQFVRYSALTREKTDKTNQLRTLILHDHDI
jgi:hypothetical protein